MIAFFFLLAHLCFAVFLFFLFLSFLTGAPFVPSQKKSVQAMVSLAHLKPGMIVYDLGSGDGRVLVEAAKRGAKPVGVEMNPFLVLLCRLKKLNVRWQNLWNADISEAQVVFVYLLPHHMNKLERKLKKELKPGSLIVSNSFIFPHWNILRKDEKNHVYVFRVI